MVKVNGIKSDTFKITNTRDPLPALLFNLALKKIIRGSGVNAKGTIYNSNHQCIAYADDVALIARTLKRLQKTIKDLNHKANKMGLSINQSKS